LIRWAAIASLALVAPVTASAQDAAADTVVMPGIEIALRPERNKAGDVESVLVTFQLTDTVSVAAMLEFRAPVELDNLPGIADRIRGFRVDDSIGAVLMTREDDSLETSGFGYNRRWRTARSVSFPVTVNYRAVGTIVASKMIDAFNLSGSKYDSAGRLRDWLKPDEFDRLNAIGGTLAERYSAFEPVPGVHPRGKVLTDEALSDIGALEIALDAYHATSGAQAAASIDGLTVDQRFFLGRAQSWRARFTPDAIRNQLTQGSNAIPWMRVNGPLPNIDEWYQAFGIAAGDKLYLPPEKRVRLW